MNFRLKEKEAEEARKRPAEPSATPDPAQKQTKVDNGAESGKDVKSSSLPDKKVNGIKPTQNEIDRLEPLTDVMIPKSRYGFCLQVFRRYIVFYNEF